MNEQLKPFKTVEQIAKKHRLDVSFIQKQLDIGEPIEHEHTKNHDLAREIALQHLDEIPDYYTRLKKMEADAKKHHKKFKDAKVNEDLRNWFDKLHPEGNWRRFNTKGEAIGPCAREPGEPKPKCLSNEKAAKMSKSEIAAAVKRKRKADPVADREGKGGKPKMVSNKISEEHNHEEERYCPLCDKREARSQCSYGEKAWDKVSVKDEEYSMVRGELKTLMDAAKRINSRVGRGEGNLEAWVQSKITKATDYLDTAADYLDSGEHDIEEAKGPCWKGYRKKPRTADYEEGSCVKVKVKESAEVLTEKNKPTNPKLWAKWKAKAKAKFDVYPSAYANGWAAKGYKSEGGGWRSANESVTIEDAEGNTFAEVVDIITPDPIKGFKTQMSEATRMQAQTGNIIAVTLSWRGKYYSLKMFFPQVKLPTRKEISDEIQKVYPGSNVVYHSVSEIQPGKPLIQACGPQGGSVAKVGSNKNYVKPMGEEVEISEAKKSEMKCNKPKAEAHGSGETGKSHVVKACEGGKEKLIRFGQLGVKGSPKKEGESKEYASRRRKFKKRHAKNIARGKMSAAYWANKVKW